MEEHMYVIFVHLSMLMGQTTLPPNRPNHLKVNNMYNFAIYQLIWLKITVDILNLKL